MKLLDSGAADRAFDKLASLLTSYFRVRVQGLKHIPKTGGAIIIPNHSGFSGADAIVLMHTIRKRLKRRPRVLAHRTFFELFPWIGNMMTHFGIKKACFEAGAEVLQRKHLLLLFPEAEQGNFKSSLKRYKLQTFHTGFLRMAITAQVPVIPCVIVGAEESHLNLGNIDLHRIIPHLTVPLPLNLVPFPAKWTIRFLEPIQFLEFPVAAANDSDLLQEMSEKLRNHLSSELKKDLKKRKNIFV